MVVKRNWILDKWDDDWVVQFSSMDGPSSAKGNVVEIPTVDEPGVSHHIRVIPRQHLLRTVYEN